MGLITVESASTEFRVSGMMKNTYNGESWDKFWRLYKTRRGARAYAKRHNGVWVIIAMNPELLSAKEMWHGLGTWLVGRSDEYLFYHGKGLTNFEDDYRVMEIYADGVLVSDYNEERDEPLSNVEDSDGLILMGSNILNLISTEIEASLAKDNIGEKWLKTKEGANLKESLVAVSGCILRAKFLENETSQATIRQELEELESRYSHSSR